MATAASCCCVSSHGLSRPLPRLRTARLRLRLRLVFPSAPSPRLSSRIPASPDPPLDDWPAPDDDQDQEQEDRDEGIGFQIQVSKVGKRNRRLVRVHAPLDAVWATLTTDYEGLADFIPGLSECRLLDQHDGFARLYQVGEQDLALGFNFNAKGTIDCYEGGDFKLFQGKWSVEEVDGTIVEGGGNSEEQEFQTTLSYLLELEPKLWVPVRLLEGRICSEIKNNLVCIREQAQRIHRLQHE